MKNVHCSRSASLKDRDWFWGVVLIYLLIIGCVESNPGPRSYEAPETGQPRRNYGSIENRHRHQWDQGEMSAAASGCWPLTWWCKGEPLSDEENILERRERRGPGGVQSSLEHIGRIRSSEHESEDDALLQDHQAGPVILTNQHGEIDRLKEEVTLLRNKLELEVKQRQEERHVQESKIVTYRKSREESARIHEDLHTKLDETVLQKALLEQQILELEYKNEKMHTEEFLRRKQLEEELEKEVQERKRVTEILEQEILKRQLLEQDMRLQKLNREAELRERNREQDIQTRQLQHAIEMEVQIRQELTQQVDNEMKLRKEEQQQRHRLEVQLEEEIKARKELEKEFMQADLQSQILEQELRLQLTQMERVLNNNENEVTEVIPLNGNEEAGSTESSGSDTSTGEDASDKTEEKGDAGDNKNDDDDDDDDDEKQEIRQLLLEEFERLQPEQDRANLSSNKNADTGVAVTSTIDATPQHSGELGTVSMQDQRQLEELIETDLKTDFRPINRNDLLQMDQQEEDSGDTKVNYNISITEASDDVGTASNSHKNVATAFEAAETDIVIRDKDNIQLSLSVGYDERRKGFLLPESLSLGLESIVEEQKTCDFDTVTEYDSKSQENDYSNTISKIIKFQGKDVTVASLIGELIVPETEVLLHEFKTSLSTEMKPVIGCACADIEGPYIPRTLQRNTFVRSDILKQVTSKLPPAFAVSGMTEEELKEAALPYENICHFAGRPGIEKSSPRIVLLNDVTAARDFKDLCNRTRNFKTIHWLAKQHDCLEWRGSKGNMDVIKQYIDFSKNKHITSITNLKGETLIISGNPGEGKSTYLTHLQSAIKETSPDTWVIRLNLNEHRSLIEKCDVTETHVFEILASAAGLEKSPSASLGKALLTYSLQIMGNVVVLVDEIRFGQRDKIHTLLRILKNMKIMNLVIAASSNITPAIENSLSTLAFTLKPLTEEELHSLMTKFLKTNLQHDDENLRDKFSAELLRIIGKHSISDNSPTPMDITIVSHIFDKEYMSSLVTNVVNLPKILDKTELYERYIEWEFEMRKDKNGGSENLWHSYLAHITHSSMSTLFPEDDIDKILPLEESTRMIRGTYPLPCRNLQEYVTAKWFAENYQDHRSFIEDKYFEAELQTMWEIFERIVAKQSELHISVLERDIQRVRDLLSSGLDINSLDKCGRTALHISALQGKYFDRKAGDQCVDITSLLIDQGADISIADGILNWTALRYADKTGSWTIIDKLLQEAAADISDMTCTKHKLRDSIFLQDILTEAAVNGLKNVVEFVLHTGVDINTPLHSTRYSHQQYGLVHIASENGCPSLLRFLLEKYADANKCIWDKSTPLHLACKQGNNECVLALLESFARTDESNKKGDTPLHEAVRSRNSDIVQILLNKKADTDVCNNDGDTPLHVACQLNNLTAVSQLIDTNMYKNNRNKNGDSPLDCAVRAGHTALVKYISKVAKASVMDRKMNGHTPVHLAAETGDVLMLEYLLQVVPEIDVCTDGGDTPLHIASLNGNTDAVAFLLKEGADTNRPNKHGNAALHLASVPGHMSTMKALLECNADVNVTNQEGNTPLHLVCLRGHANVVRCLLTYNVNVDARNRQKNTALHLAAIKGDSEVMTSLIEANCDVNLPNKNGETILHQCAKNGKLDTVKLLVDTGRCQLDATDCTGDTPLLAATRSGFADIVECLARKGADINGLANDGEAPIHLAVMRADVELVSKLCCLGADLNICNSSGNTPLHKAVYSGNEMLIRKLVEQGADRSIKDLSGYTPLELAVHLGSNDTIRRVL